MHSGRSIAAAVCVTCFLLAPATPCALAQHEGAGTRIDGSITVQTYPSAGFPSPPRVWSIAKDAWGFLYAGTGEGLYEFDGRSWKHIEAPEMSPMFSLLHTRTGRLYCGMAGYVGRLERDRRGAPRFRSLAALLGSVAGSTSQFDIILETRSAVWAGTRRGELFRIAGGTPRAWTFAGGVMTCAAVGDTLLVMDARGELFFLRADTPVPIAAIRGYARRPDVLLHALRRTDGSVLLVTASSGLFVWDRRGVRPLASVLDRHPDMYPLSCAVNAPDGSLALGGISSGLTLLEPGYARLRRVTTADGLQSDAVCSLCPDGPGAWWVGLENGLNRVVLHRGVRSFGPGEGLEGLVTGVVHLRGELLVGTTTGLFASADGSAATGDASRKFRLIRTLECSHLIAVEDGALCATSSGTLVYRGGRLKVLDPRPSRRISLPPGRDDIAIVGMEDGLFLLRRAGGGWLGEKSMPDFQEFVVEIAAEDSSHAIVGSGDGALYRIEIVAESPGLRVAARYSASEGVPSGALAPMRFGERLIVLHDSGVYRFDSDRRLLRDTAFTRMIALKPGSTAYPLACDRRGRWWYQRDRSSEVVEVRPRADGSAVTHAYALTPVQPYALSVIEPEPRGDGVWFGTVDRLWRFDVATATALHGGPPLARIRAVRVHVDSLLLEDACRVDLRVGPTLPYSLNDIAFEYAAPQFDLADSLQYQWRLDGRDDRWSPWEYDARRAFTNLYEGTYSFRVRARDVFGRVGPEARLTFTVLPPWYRSWWAVTLYVLLALAFVTVVVLVRTRGLRQRNLHLAAVVQARTREITQQAERIREQAGDLERIDDMVRVLNGEMEYARMLQALLEFAHTLLPHARRVVFYQVQPGRTVMQPLVVAGSPEHTGCLSFDVGRLRLYLAARSESLPDSVHRVVDGVAFHREVCGIEMDEVGPMLLLRIEIEEEFVGVLSFEAEAGGGFDEDDVHRLQSMHGHVVSAVLKTRYLQMLQDANRQLVEHKEQLVTQEKLAALGSLAAGVAHELQNPLNFITNFSELAGEMITEIRAKLHRRRGSGDGLIDSLAEAMDELHAAYVRIQEHGQQMSTIVSSMLLHTGQRTFRSEAVDINDLVSRMAGISYHAVRVKHPALAPVLAKDLDPRAGQLEVMPEQLARALQNILANGWDAAVERSTRHGGEPPTLRVLTRVGREDDREVVEIRIRDNGTGIPDDIRSRIFEPFFTTKTSLHATGLGLSISHDIITSLHRGRLLVQSEPGNASEFIITLHRTHENGGA